MKYIYEVTDVTDEEVYFSLGVFRSFLEATNAVKGDEPPETPADHEDHAAFNIRRRRLGKFQPFSQGRRVATVKWLLEYSEEKDDFLWRTPTVTLNDNNTGEPLCKPPA